MKKILFPSIIILLIISMGMVNADELKGLKKRVAVFNFEDQAGYGHRIGNGLSDMLITALVETKKFIVIERSELDQILTEQGLGMSGAVTPQSAAKVGQLLGVELMITGSVSEFGTTKKKVGGGLSKLGGLRLGVGKEKARAAVDLRLVSTSTGEIMGAEKAEGEESTTSLDKVGMQGIDFHNSSTWDNTILGKAARKAIDKSVKIIVKAMESVPWQGKVIKGNPDGTLYMKPGSQGGVKPGMTFWVYRPGEEIIDPDTGISLGSEEMKVGQIQVTGDIGEGKAAKAIVKSGSNLQTGDLIRVK
jgi:curli biogenesis system outer membrane secretion channel CsgG